MSGKALRVADYLEHILSAIERSGPRIRRGARNGGRLRGFSVRAKRGEARR
jgi:hypothetical protein